MAVEKKRRGMRGGERGGSRGFGAKTSIRKKGSKVKYGYIWYIVRKQEASLRTLYGYVRPSQPVESLSQLAFLLVGLSQLPLLLG